MGARAVRRLREAISAEVASGGAETSEWRGAVTSDARIKGMEAMVDSMKAVTPATEQLYTSFRKV